MRVQLHVAKARATAALARQLIDEPKEGMAIPAKYTIIKPSFLDSPDNKNSRKSAPKSLEYFTPSGKKLQVKTATIILDSIQGGNQKSYVENSTLLLSDRRDMA